MLKQMIDRIWSGGNSPHDSEIYAQIHNELSSGQMDPGLWTKATAVSDGNADKAKSRYIEMRANALRQERKELLALAKSNHCETLRVQNVAIEQERWSREVQQLRSEEARLIGQLWIRFYSPEAKRIKRNKNLINTVIYAAFCVLFYIIWSENELYILPILIGFFAWIMSLATYGRVELDSQLEKVRNRIAKSDH